MASGVELQRLSCQHLEEIKKSFSRRYSSQLRSAPPQPRPLAILSEALCSSGRATGNPLLQPAQRIQDRKSTRLNSSHRTISYAVFCLKKKKKNKLIALIIYKLTPRHTSRDV